MLIKELKFYIEAGEPATRQETNRDRGTIMKVPPGLSGLFTHAEGVRGRAPVALVMAPTRELAQQVSKEVESVAPEPTASPVAMPTLTVGTTLSNCCNCPTARTISSPACTARSGSFSLALG